MTAETHLPEPDDASPFAPNQVFVLRLWRTSSVEWRGRVQQVASGETRYFRAWPGLVAHLEALLADETASDNQGAGGKAKVTP